MSTLVHRADSQPGVAATSSFSANSTSEWRRRTYWRTGSRRLDLPALRPARRATRRAGRGAVRPGRQAPNSERLGDDAGAQVLGHRRAARRRRSRRRWPRSSRLEGRAHERVDDLTLEREHARGAYRRRDSSSSRYSSGTRRSPRPTPTSEPGLVLAVVVGSRRWGRGRDGRRARGAGRARRGCRRRTRTRGRRGRRP